MKVSFLLILITLAFNHCHTTLAQDLKQLVDLSKVNDSKACTTYNRKVSYADGVLAFNAQPQDGLVWFNNIKFSDGVIEVDLKGSNTPGRSFIGVAFHVENEERFDAIYFRPFNFKSPTRSKNSIQYIAHPSYSWPLLRKEYPGQYESDAVPAPDPDDWFHIRIEVRFPTVKVFVNNSPTPSLSIDQLSDRKSGWVGLWVGNNSDGEFKNLSLNAN